MMQKYLFTFLCIGSLIFADTKTNSYQIYSELLSMYDELAEMRLNEKRYDEKRVQLLEKVIEDLNACISYNLCKAEMASKRKEFTYLIELAKNHTPPVTFSPIQEEEITKACTVIKNAFAKLNSILTKNPETTHTTVLIVLNMAIDGLRDYHLLWKLNHTHGHSTNEDKESLKVVKKRLIETSQRIITAMSSDAYEF